MQKTIRRVIALMLALAMVLSLAACGGSTTNGGTTTGGTSGVSAENAFDTDAFIASMPEELKGTTITFLNWYNIEDRATEKANIEAFEAASGINVEVIAPEYKLYTDKLASMVATGDAPDVIRMSEPNMAWMKYLQPITNTGYDFSDDAWNSEVKELYSANGIQYAANLSYTPFVLFSVCEYATDTMEEWGFEDPWELWQKGKWTWEKMNEMSTEWIKQGPDYYGLGTVNFDAPATTAGLDFVTYDGSQWKLNLYDTEVLDVWKKIIEYRENRLSGQSTNLNFGQVKSKVLFNYVDSTGMESHSSGKKLFKRGVWGVAPMPKWEGEEYYAPVTELVAWGVPTGAKNPEAVPYFISWYGNLAKYNLEERFLNEQAKEVFEELVSQPNRMMNMSSSMFNFDANPFIWALYSNATSSQVTTYVQAQEYKCQDKINQWNDVLTRMDTTITK